MALIDQMKDKSRMHKDVVVEGIAPTANVEGTQGAGTVPILSTSCIRNT